MSYQARCAIVRSSVGGLHVRVTHETRKMFLCHFASGLRRLVPKHQVSLRGVGRCKEHDRAVHSLVAQRGKG